MVYTLINHGFLTSQSATPGPMYIISIYDNETHKRRKTQKKNQKSLRNQTKTPRNRSSPPCSTILACDTASVAGQLAMFVVDGGKDRPGNFGAVEYIRCCCIVNSVTVFM